MFFNRLSGWMYPTPKLAKCQTLVFLVSFLRDHVQPFADGTHRTFYAGIGYPIVGIRHSSGAEMIVRTADGRDVTADANGCTIHVYVESDSWTGAHDVEHTINARNVRSRRKAIKAGKPYYGFYTSAERDATPMFYVACRTGRNAVNGCNRLTTEQTARHASLHEPTPAVIAGKEDTPAQRHPLTDR